MKRLTLFAIAAAMAVVVQAETTPPLNVSGIYPHLTVYNSDSSGECGIGGVVPWAGKLWLLTYPPHETTGGPDKLYAIAPT